MLPHTSSAKKKSSFSAEELDDDELNRVEDCKPVCVWIWNQYFFCSNCPINTLTAAVVVALFEVLVPSWALLNNTVGFFSQKKPKRKGFIPTPRKSNTSNGQSDPLGFSHQIPQRAFNVCLPLGYHYNNWFDFICNLLFCFLFIYSCRLPLLRMTSLKQGELSWALKRCMTANMMNQKPANRYFTHSHVNYYCFTFWVI